MRILFITQYFPPETGAAQNRLSDLAGRLASAGHSVTVLTAMPNYMAGEVFPQYRRKYFMVENVGLLTILRMWIYATKSKGFISRLANYLSFTFTSLMGALFKLAPHDVVVVESPPLFLGLTGLIVSWWWRAKFVFNVSDLWPKSAVELKILRNPALIKAATVMEEFIYRHADLITGQTQGIVANVQSRVNVPTLLYTNGADITEVSSDVRNKTRDEFSIPRDAFVAGFVGLHGLVYDLDLILSAAECLANRRDILFVFFGDGPNKRSLQESVKQRRLNNVKFFEPEPKERMPEIIGALDISVAALKRSDLFKGTLPAKLFETLGAGIPVVYAAEGEAKDLIERATGGLCVLPEDLYAFSNAVVHLREHRDTRLQMGLAGRQFIARHYDRRMIAEKVELALVQLLGRAARSPTQIAVEGS